MSKELFNKKFVHCVWDDCLIGKEVFVADFMGDLMGYVEEGEKRYVVRESNSIDHPFQEHVEQLRYAYYDPLYDIKRAYMQGKVVQYYDWTDDTWKDIRGFEPAWTMAPEHYRIKPLEGAV